MRVSPGIIVGNETQVDMDMSATSTDQPKELCSSGDEHVPKARKTYTITKQRERWTDEEHDKFIEALKLYGRAWCRIEEHVGSKTAVQIRSHAQKFFSKVARESSSNNTNSVKPIEIPPPRPKRKPLHPYPRKLRNPSIKGVPASHKSERNLSPVQSISEAETQSPISVLSSNSSDVIGSSISNALRHCRPTDTHTSSSSPNDFNLCQNENFNFQPSSPEEENGSSVSGTTSVDETLDGKPRMESDDALVEAPVTSLRLFGKIVLPSDLSRTTPSVVVKELGSSQSILRDEMHVEMEKHVQSTSLIQEETVTEDVAQHDSSVLSCQFSLNPWSCGALPPFYCFPSKEGLMNTTQNTTAALTPWWSFCGGLPLPLMHLPNLGLYHHHSGFGNETIVSNRSSKSSVEKESAEELQEMVGNTNAKLAPEKQMKGFVPYKRLFI